MLVGASFYCFSGFSLFASRVWGDLLGRVQVLPLRWMVGGGWPSYFGDVRWVGGFVDAFMQEDLLIMGFYEVNDVPALSPS